MIMSLRIVLLLRDNSCFQVVKISEEPCNSFKHNWRRAFLSNVEMLDVFNGPPRDTDISPNGWRMENIDDDVRRLVISWPKQRTLTLPLDQTFISLSILRIIAENCRKLRYLRIPLDTSTISPFDTSSKSLRHNLEVLIVAMVPSRSSQKMQECRIRVARYLDSIFPFLKSIEVENNNIAWSGICDLIKLCQDIRRVI